MRLTRVRVPRPWRWRPRRTAPDAAPAASPQRSGHAEDLLLIRHTRLRLMAVSGVVTLLILVVLEGATYATVSNRVENAALDQLNAAAGIHVTLGDDPFGYAMAGPGAGVGAVIVDSQAQVV